MSGDVPVVKMIHDTVAMYIVDVAVSQENGYGPSFAAL